MSYEHLPNSSAAPAQAVGVVCGSGLLKVFGTVAVGLADFRDKRCNAMIHNTDFPSPGVAEIMCFEIAQGKNDAPIS